ncbi:hypothetical protein PENSPDRAFT_473609 [Peniophora sp. CONT]|nr:hypothetical protein PENSPDRAFT_473609 [Peniophora sp. CONT]
MTSATAASALAMTSARTTGEQQASLTFCVVEVSAPTSRFKSKPTSTTDAGRPVVPMTFHISHSSLSSGLTRDQRASRISFQISRGRRCSRGRNGLKSSERTNWQSDVRRSGEDMMGVCSLAWRVEQLDAGLCSQADTHLGFETSSPGLTDRTVQLDGHVSARPVAALIHKKFTSYAYKGHPVRGSEHDYDNKTKNSRNNLKTAAYMYGPV